MLWCFNFAASVLFLRGRDRAHGETQAWRLRPSQTRRADRRRRYAPLGAAWPPCPGLLLWISPGSSASNDNVGEPTSRGPRRQLAQAQKTLLKLPQNGNLFCLKQQYTYRLACLRAPARSAKDNMKMRNAIGLSSDTEKSRTRSVWRRSLCHLRQKSRLSSHILDA